MRAWAAPDPAPGSPSKRGHRIKGISNNTIDISSTTTPQGPSQSGPQSQTAERPSQPAAAAHPRAFDVSQLSCRERGGRGVMAFCEAVVWGRCGTQRMGGGGGRRCGLLQRATVQTERREMPLPSAAFQISKRAHTAGRWPVSSTSSWAPAFCHLFDVKRLSSKGRQIRPFSYQTEAHCTATLDTASGARGGPSGSADEA